MFHIKPIEYSDANKEIKGVFDDISKTLNLTNVPIFFQLIANFNDYLLYIWPQIKQNLEDDKFIEIVKNTQKITEEYMSEVYQPDSSVVLYVSKNLQLTQQKQFIQEDLKKVIYLNTVMLLIFISLREAVKGWAIGIKKLEDQSRYKTFNTDLPNESPKRQTQQLDMTTIDDFEIISSHDDLAETTKNISQSFYPKFLALLMSEMQELIKNKEYLYKRVELEEYVLSQIQMFPHLIDSSYSKVSKFGYKYTHFDELIYMLGETFPTQIVSRLTTSMLGRILLVLAK